jgi:Undecaprenyl-phosphate glucose phosphotransferase
LHFLQKSLNELNIFNKKMQHTRHSKNIFFIQLILDLAFLTILFFYFLKIQYLSIEQDYTLSFLLKAHYKALILFIVSWYFISVNVRLYNISRFSGLIPIFKKIFYQIALFSIIVFAVSGFKTSDLFSNKLSLFFLTSLFILTFFSRCLVFIFLKIYRRFGGNYRRIVFVDENENTYSFINLLFRRKDYGFITCGNFLSGIKNDEEKKIYDFDLTRLKHFILEGKIQIVFFSLNGKLKHKVQEDIVFLAQKLHIEVRFIPSTIYDSFSSLKLEYYDTFPVFTFNEFPLDNFWSQFSKRTFDIIFSSLAFIFIFSWLFPIISLAILLDSGSPVFYPQKRIGLRGRSFYCYKFRTMKPSKDNDIKATVKGDKRITKLGHFLRKYSLDELPQFFNVLKGNMSIVGPRPHMVVQDKYYNDIMLKYSLRHYVKPGITGLAQVKGFRGEINSGEDMRKRIIADIYYVKNWSFFLDIIIILRTFFKTLAGDEKAI